jgi:hypothetical protein
MKSRKPLTGRESSILSLLVQSQSLEGDEVTRILEELKPNSDARMIANVLVNRLSGKETKAHKEAAKGFEVWAKSLGQKNKKERERITERAIGIYGFSTAIGLLSKNDCFDVDEEVLIGHLCKQFETTPIMARKAVEHAIWMGIIARVHMGEGYCVIKMVCNPDLYAPEVMRARHDVFLRELKGRFGITERQAGKIIKSAVDAGVLEETEADGEKLLRFKK